MGAVPALAGVMIKALFDTVFATPAPHRIYSVER